MFLVKKWGQRIFSAESFGRIFGQKSTSEIPKFKEILKKEKKQHFFFRMWLQMSYDVSKKKFQSFIYSMQSPRINFGLNYCFKQQKMNFEETSYISNVRKNEQKNFTFLVRILV
jgi:hypothetical protein